MNFRVIPFTVFLLSTLSISAQNKKVGIQTNTPTEMLDVSGTMRVRTLPNHGTTYVNGQGSTQTFTAANPVVISSDSYNVLGKTDKANFVPNNTTIGFDTTDNSTAMFVIKRYSNGDWPSATGNAATLLGAPTITTGMSSSKWVAILSNVSFGFSEINSLGNVFNEKHLHSWQLVDKDGVWKLWGDINGVKEKSDYVDVLYINKKFVSSEARTALFPW